MPNDTKPAIQSVSIWGSLIALLSLIAPVLLPHLGLSGDDAQTVVKSVSTIVTGVASLVAIYGRVVATMPISGVVKGAGQ